MTIKSDYSNVLPAVAESLNLYPLVFESMHISGDTVDVILSTSPKFFTVSVDGNSSSDHYPLFALFTFLETNTQMISILSMSSSSKTHLIESFSPNF